MKLTLKCSKIHKNLLFEEAFEKKTFTLWFFYVFK